MQLRQDLEKLKKDLLLLGAMVEDAVHKAILAFVEGRKDLASEVITGDREIDDREVQIEEDCLKVLALHSPVASDLRFILAVIKVNNDLERVGDLARNIAERGQAREADFAVPVELRNMSDQVRQVLRESLAAVVEADVEMARHVLDQDDEIDARHARIYNLSKDLFTTDPPQVDSAIHLLSVSRFLERIADMATNIAEEVVFLVHGKVIRHQGH